MLARTRRIYFYAGTGSGSGKRISIGATQSFDYHNFTFSLQILLLNIHKFHNCSSDKTIEIQFFIEFLAFRQRNLNECTGERGEREEKQRKNGGGGLKRHCLFHDGD
jgi:hypothetical protein